MSNPDWWPENPYAGICQVRREEGFDLGARCGVRAVIMRIRKLAAGWEQLNMHDEAAAARDIVALLIREMKEVGIE